jgi:hypothetical protein
VECPHLGTYEIGSLYNCVMRLGSLRERSSSCAPTYSYSRVANANPDAVTQIATGYSTTSLVYDADGNVIQRTVDGTTTTYVYDYANRLTALGVGGATTTYAYDAFRQRVLQTGTTMTYMYLLKWYSIAPRFEMAAWFPRARFVPGWSPPLRRRSGCRSPST